MRYASSDIAAKRWHKSHPEFLLWRLAKARAKAKRLEFTITQDDIFIPDRCPVLDIPLFKNTSSGPCDNSPTIDRLDSDRGYTPENILVVSHKANRLKNNGTLEEIVSLAVFLAKQLKIANQLYPQ